MFEGKTEIDLEAIKELYETLSVIDEKYFLNGNEWIAGSTVTIADFAYVSTIAGILVR